VKQVTADPFTETTRTARTRAFDELAAKGPVQRLTLFTGVTVWLITGHAETRQVLSDPAVAKSFRGGPHADKVSPKLNEAMRQHVLSANPPDHTRLRRLVNAAFTRRRVESLEPRIKEIADSLLDDVAAAGADGSPVDLVGLFSYPLPITVICELLGVPTLRRGEFRRLSSVVVNGSTHTAEAYIDAATEMVDLVRDLIVQKQSDPGEDLMSDLIAVRDAGDKLSSDELSSMVFLLLVAGHETTVSLITNGVHALLTHPGQLARLRADKGLVPNAVEEFLRYDGPVMVTVPAKTMAPVRVGGVTIPAGEVVVPTLFTANRDPGRFDRPDELDVARKDNPHMAFGHGIHHCVGASLARLEGRIAIGRLLERFPDLRLAADEEPTRVPALLINAMSSLPVLVR
jgi:cytochrome P450